jgi:translation initiation factor 4E
VANLSIFNNIAKTSEIPLKSDYALFKKGVRPEWEDAANKEGGKWSYQFKRNAGIDELWLYTVHHTPTWVDVDACGDWRDD